jgi:hypothetical protein
MSKKCCRSSPRCADCPVSALAAARKHRELNETTALVTEILAGRAARPLPPSVAAALEHLRAAAAPSAGSQAACTGESPR